MIETTSSLSNNLAAAPAQPSAGLGKKYNFGLKSAGIYEDTRTAGPAPKTRSLASAKDQSVAQLEQAESEQGQFEYVLSYALQEPDAIETKAQDEGYSFYDVLDVVNPLQHLPIVGTLYRAISGDELRAAPRILGGAIFGGGVGAISSTANVILEHETGRDAAGNALAAITGQPLGRQDVPDIRIDHSRNLLNHHAGVFTKSDHQQYRFEEILVEADPQIKNNKNGENFSRKNTRHTEIISAYERRYNS